MKVPGVLWANRIRHLRVLVVEDDALVVLFLESLFQAVGVEETLDVAQTLDTACWLAQTGRFDFALLDVYLNGEPSFAVAEALQVKGIPFAFASGFASDEARARFPNVPVLAKPFQMAELEALIIRALDHTR